MMRAAHSIKGAGRILGIDPAVRVSHVMEDCFVAAQERRLTLRPDHVDVLLRGVDMLIRLKNNTKASVDWSQFNAEVEPLVAGVAMVNGPSRAFAIEQLIEGAWRCLDGASIQGTHAVKTIEVY